LSTEREPICGFCWAYRKIRQPLLFEPALGWWRCPICNSAHTNPSLDEESIRQDLLAMAEADKETWEDKQSRLKNLHACSGPPRSFRNTKSGRSRKKPRNGPKIPMQSEIDSAVFKHNRKVRQEAGLE
jgi:hypothetical protein